jgi:hypothetical protein
MMTWNRFKLMADIDMIAIGVQWPDNTCTLYWLRYHAIGNYQSVQILKETQLYGKQATYLYTASSRAL